MAKKKRKNKMILLIALLLAAAALAITVSEKTDGPLPTWEELYTAVGITESQTNPEDILTVHFIDVGQGDSILIQAPDGAMLIDAGERGNEQKMERYLRKYRIRKLDYVVATHPHSDHIGSMPAVLDSFAVSHILMPQLTQSNTPTNTVYKNFLSAVQRSKKKGAEVLAAKPGITFSVGRADCTVLSPKTQTDDLNDMSVVLRVDWGSTSFLFMGDAGLQVEKELRNGEFAGKLNVDVLKVGHHGSSNASGQSFLTKVSPMYSVISCGKNNDYGHPHDATIQKLQKMNTTVLRTDEKGSIRVVSDGENLRWESDHG